MKKAEKLAQQADVAVLALGEAVVQGGEGGTVTMIIQEALKAGDKVLMLRVMKGQKYVILSRL